MPEVVQGAKMVKNATINEVGGGVETWNSLRIKRGRTTVSHRTDDMPDGLVEHKKVITTGWGELDETGVATRVPPDHMIVRSSNAVDGVLLAPRSSS